MTCQPGSEEHVRLCLAGFRNSLASHRHRSLQAGGSLRHPKWTRELELKMIPQCSWKYPKHLPKSRDSFMGGTDRLWFCVLWEPKFYIWNLRRKAGLEKHNPSSKKGVFCCEERAWNWLPALLTFSEDILTPASSSHFTPWFFLLLPANRVMNNTIINITHSTDLAQLQWGYMHDIHTSLAAIWCYQMGVLVPLLLSLIKLLKVFNK